MNSSLILLLANILQWRLISSEWSKSGTAATDEEDAEVPANFRQIVKQER